MAAGVDRCRRHRRAEGGRRAARLREGVDLRCIVAAQAMIVRLCECEEQVTEVAVGGDWDRRARLATLKGARDPIIELEEKYSVVSCSHAKQGA